MRSTIIIGAILVVIAAFLLFSRRTPIATFQKGGFSDIQPFLHKLMHSQSPNAFLVIKVTDTADFLQFTAANGILQMDYPLITDDQKSHAEQLSAACKALDLTPKRNTGTDGSEFLDCDISGTPSEMASIVQKVFETVFGVSKDQQLTFEGSGLAEERNSQPSG